MPEIVDKNHLHKIKEVHTMPEKQKQLTPEDFRKAGEKIAQASSRAETAEQKSQELSVTVDSILTEVLPSLMG